MYGISQPSIQGLLSSKELGNLKGKTRNNIKRTLFARKKYGNIMYQVSEMHGQCKGR